MTIELTTAESETLREILHGVHDELLREMSRAESLEFKKLLRPREALVTKVLEQLGAANA
jgi:hypothetical protein